MIKLGLMFEPLGDNMKKEVKGTLHIRIERANLITGLSDTFVEVYAYTLRKNIAEKIKPQ